jgi:4-carboxymuconolactone decarboxylase
VNLIVAQNHDSGQRVRSKHDKPQSSARMAFMRFIPGTVLILALATGANAQQPSAATTPSKRFPQIKLEETSGAQRAMADRMLKETRAGITGPWNVALRSPGMATGFIELYNYFKNTSELGPRLVEMGICTTAREFDVAYEWQVHQPLAVQAGVSAAALADIRDGRAPRGLKPDEQAVYDFATEFLRKHFVSDATFDRTKSLLGEKNTVDLAALVGTYVTFGAILNVGEVPNVRPKDSPEYMPVNPKK